MINSFHVWESPHFAGGQDEHFRIVSEVKSEFMAAPHPAWTAVGTTGLLASTGLVEIQVIAHVPSAR
jgi:enamine deaminase RidA (YjgF/YER057c/UK114 family)